MNALSELLDVLQLQRVGEARFRAFNLGEEGAVAFGGELVGQTIVAARTVLSNHDVKTVHTLFARSAIVGTFVDIEVEVMQSGRTFSSATVTTSQDGRLCNRALVLASSGEPDLIRHAAPSLVVDQPDGLQRSPGMPAWWDVRIVGGIDIHEAEQVLPPELFMWSRIAEAPDDPVIAQALIAYASDGFLIGTAMLPHAGIGQSMAHISISTTVMTHTLTFHEPFDASAWLLFALESPYAGRGRSYGRANVFTSDGRLVGSFVQDAMIRAFPQGDAPQSGQRARH
jgi:acyl-CoA thioesterase